MNIREIRKELCLSQVEFARLLGVHQTAVSQWETGRTSPEVVIAKRIARVSGHSLDEVLNAEDKPPLDEEGVFSLTVIDDGLRGQRIRKGDMVYLRPQAAYQPYDIVALEAAAGAMVRLLVEEGGKQLLLADTPRPALTEVTRDTKIIGKVIGFYAEISPRTV